MGRLLPSGLTLPPLKLLSLNDNFVSKITLIVLVILVSDKMFPLRPLSSQIILRIATRIA
jgi:hypothetical protein